VKKRELQKHLVKTTDFKVVRDRHLEVVRIPKGDPEVIVGEGWAKRLENGRELIKGDMAKKARSKMTRKRSWLNPDLGRKDE